MDSISIRNFFESASFAVVGATDRPEKWGYRVFKRLLKLERPVYPIHPKVKEIDGIHVYESLSLLPSIPEAVNLIVNPSVTEKVVEECLRLGIKKVWMQPGAESETAVEFCRKNGIDVVYHDCVLIHSEY